MTSKIWTVAALALIGFIAPAGAQEERRGPDVGDVLRELVPPARGHRDEYVIRKERMHRLHEACDDGDDDACRRLRYMHQERRRDDDAGR